MSLSSPIRTRPNSSELPHVVTCSHLLLHNSHTENPQFHPAIWLRCAFNNLLYHPIPLGVSDASVRTFTKLLPILTIIVTSSSGFEQP
jgi:hypothetical protein